MSSEKRIFLAFFVNEYNKCNTLLCNLKLFHHKECQKSSFTQSFKATKHVKMNDKKPSHPNKDPNNSAVVKYLQFTHTKERTCADLHRC